MRAVIAILALVCVIQAIPNGDVLENEWEQFKVEYKKAYESLEELQLRKQIFLKNKHEIDAHNMRYAAGKVSFQLGVNQFADLTSEEFVSRMLSSLDTSEANAKREIVYSAPENVQLPKSVDWRSEGAVTKVKNQGKCGSCWSFAAAGTLEGQNFIKKGRKTSLSEQNLVDCASIAPYTNNGCNGGWPAKALKYVRDNGGINSESNYPYEAVQKKCRYNKEKIAAKVKDISYVQADEDSLASAIANNGPISVAVDARNFKAYKGGVFDLDCEGEINHAVLVVGYGSDSRGGAYWLVKNSWGTSWGEEGYIRIPRNRNNKCSIASHGVFPLV